MIGRGGNLKSLAATLGRVKDERPACAPTRDMLRMTVDGTGNDVKKAGVGSERPRRAFLRSRACQTDLMGATDHPPELSQ